MKRVAVIGAGIGGLSAAWQLKKDGFEPVVFEAAPEPGGRMINVNFDEFFMEPAATLLCSHYSGVIGIINELGMKDELGVILHNSFCLERDGRFYVMKFASIPSAIKFAFSALSLKEMLLCLKLLPPILWNRKKLEVHSLDKASELDDENMYEYCERRLGKKLTDDIIDTALGDFFMYSTKDMTRSLGLTSVKTFISSFKIFRLKRGMGSLTGRLAKEVTTYCNSPVQRVSEKRDRVEVEFIRDGQKEVQDFDAAVVAVQGDLVPKIVEGLSQAERGFFESIHYTKAYVVGLKCSPAVKENFFPIFWSPKVTPVIAFISIEGSKDPARDEGGKGLVQVFAREEWSKKFKGKPEQAAEIIVREAERLQPAIRGKVIGTKVVWWERGMEKTPAGHYRNLVKFRERRNPQSRLFFAGSYLLLPSVEGACTTGLQAAKAVSARLR